MSVVTETTVKLILIHASVDSLNLRNSVNSVPFRENPFTSYFLIAEMKFIFSKMEDE